jgi:hypothetical protein
VTTDPGYNPSSGVWTIAPKFQLPAISSSAAIIDGYSQPGASTNTLAQGDNARVAVAIDGTAFQSTGPGLLIDHSGTQVFGLDIEDFGQLGQGVVIRSATNVQIAGCFIGVDPTGETAAPDGNGVEIWNSSNTIGGPNVGDRNVISGNYGTGIYLPDKSSNPLQITESGNVTENNYIGLDAAGRTAIINHGYGVDDFGSGNTYGGTAPGTGNVISGNYYGGINSGGSITIEGNYIGTDATGKVALGNGTPGTAIGDFEPTGATSLTTTITDNVVSGNVYGIYVSIATGSQSTCTISSNKIGTDATGTAALGNIGTGLVVTGAANAAVQNNVISANKTGVLISGDSQTATANDVLQGNFIGTDKTGLVPLGNSQDGIEINGSNVTVGGSGPGQANVIANNGGYGISMLTGKQDKFSQNSISGNANAGIHENNITNNSISPPLLTFTPGTENSGTLSGTLTGAPNTRYMIEVFSNTSAPASGQEQGHTFVKAVNVTTDNSGKGTFSLTEPIAYYTATATDPGGDTSAFSNSVGVVTLPATTTTVSSSQIPARVGQQVTFTAVVSAAVFQGTPTGTVTFSVDGHTQPPTPLSIVGGKAEVQFVTSTLTAGLHTIAAAYSGDAHVAPSNSSLLTQTVAASNSQPTVTTLSSSLNPSAVGQSLTFTAVVSPGASAGVPTGTIIFTIDGTPQTPVPLMVDNGHCQAVYGTSTFSAGKHTISASYSGDSIFAASAVPTPFLETVNAVPPPGIDGPTVVSLERFGIHMQPTVVVLGFNDGLDPTSAEDLSNYRIVGPAGRSVDIRSAAFDPVANTVTLRPRTRINIHHTYHLTVLGTGSTGVRDSQGFLLDGANTGRPGSNYTGTLTWGNVVWTPAEAKKYVHVKHVRPAGVLNHEFRS